MFSRVNTKYKTKLIIGRDFNGRVANNKRGTEKYVGIHWNQMGKAIHKRVLYRVKKKSRILTSSHN